MSQIHPKLRPVLRPVTTTLKEFAEDFRFDLFDLDLLIPKGRLIDGSSIPRVATVVTGGRFDPYHEGPSAIHDELCVLIEKAKKTKTKLLDTKGKEITQARADWIYLKCLKMNKVNLVIRWGEWGAVRTYQFFKGLF